MIEIARSHSEVAIQAANEQIKCLYSEEYVAKIRKVFETEKKMAGNLVDSCQIVCKQIRLEQIFYPHTEEFFEGNAICSNNKRVLGMKQIIEFGNTTIHSSTPTLNF